MGTNKTHENRAARNGACIKVKVKSGYIIVRKA